MSLQKNGFIKFAHISQKNKVTINKNLQISLLMNAGNPNTGVNLNDPEETPRCTSMQGSYTVEASIVFPLTLCLMLLMIFLFRLLTLQHIVGESLNETARDMSLYGESILLKEFESQEAESSTEKVASEETTESKKTKGSVAGKAAAIALCQAKLHKKKAPMENVFGGALGMNFLSTEVTDTNIHLVVDYYVKFPIPVFQTKGMFMHQEAVSRRWVGWNPSMEEENSDGVVYITPEGEAYHSTKSCSFLTVTVESVSKSQLDSARSNDGSKYYPCPFCKSTKGSNYYIASYGNRYHKKKDCLAIKRTIKQSSKEDAEAQGYHACSKCGK